MVAKSLKMREEGFGAALSCGDAHKPPDLVGLTGASAVLEPPAESGATVVESVEVRKQRQCVAGVVPQLGAAWVFL